MKKHMLLVSNLIIIFSIVAGFTGIVYRDTKTYQQLAEKQMANIVSLADTNISKHIENSMSKLVTVSKTMANDEFLKAWLMQEPNNAENNAYLDKLYSYLKTYQIKYDYTTVFCISAQTGNYYYQDGINKTISKNDEHDIWYYNFVNSNREYDLQVDTNQVNDNHITVFINFRVDGEDGKLLGVIGVGLQASFIEDTIASYEKDYDLSVYIINEGGSENSFSGNTDVFVSPNTLAKRTQIKDPIVMEKTDKSVMQWFTAGSERKCLVTKYDETLHWFLLLEKDTASISRSFQERIENNILFVLIALAACIAVTSIVFIQYNQRLVAMENTDELTGLLNRKLFLKKYATMIQKQRNAKMTLFMFDIDHFKMINDTHGHVFGNAVLSMVGEDLRTVLDGKGIAARWGGDEFIGLLTVDTSEAELIIRKLMEALRNEERDDCYRVTISAGITEVNEKLSGDQMIKKVDEALYCSKEGGRNFITVQ